MEIQLSEAVQSGLTECQFLEECFLEEAECASLGVKGIRCMAGARSVWLEVGGAWRWVGA